jgi:glycogen operon protein
MQNERWSRDPEPLGVTPTAHGANVAVVSANASAIELCRFDQSGRQEQGRNHVAEAHGDVWHGFVHGMRRGRAYGLRAHGPYDPGNGHRFNPAKLLVDPYCAGARSAVRFAQADGRRLATRGDPGRDRQRGLRAERHRDAPPAAATSVRPRVPWSRTVIYELNVRGFTRTHPGVPEALRGTLRGLAHPAALAHLTSLGITTVELMPIAAWINERHLAALGSTTTGATTRWRRSSRSAARPGGLDDVHAAVAALHAADSRSSSDVVLNHTGEGDALGPTLSLRGLDNATYYRTFAADRARYVDDTGCGNTLALDRAAGAPARARRASRLRRSSASTAFASTSRPQLGRRERASIAAAPLLSAIAQDPLLRSRKLIAEPWDVGPGAIAWGVPRRVGRMERSLSGRRARFWRGDAGRMAESRDSPRGLGRHLRRTPSPTSRARSTSSRRTTGSRSRISFPTRTSTTRRTVEGNRDGSNAGDSWNHGVEGPTADAAILAARARDVRNLLATLFLSRGTPMLAMGDESGARSRATTTRTRRTTR